MEKIFKSLFKNFSSGNKSYQKADPKSKGFYKRNKAKGKNSGTDSNQNKFFFDFIAVFSAMTSAGMAMVVMTATTMVIVAMAMILVTMVMMMFVLTAIMFVLMVMMFVLTAMIVAMFMLVFVFVTVAGHF